MVQLKKMIKELKNMNNNTQKLEIAKNEFIEMLKENGFLETTERQIKAINAISNYSYLINLTNIEILEELQNITNITELEHHAIHYLLINSDCLYYDEEFIIDIYDNAIINDNNTINPSVVAEEWTYCNECRELIPIDESFYYDYDNIGDYYSLYYDLRNYDQVEIHNLLCERVNINLEDMHDYCEACHEHIQDELIYLIEELIEEEEEEEEHDQERIEAEHNQKIKEATNINNFIYGWHADKHINIMKADKDSILTFGTEIEANYDLNLLNIDEEQFIEEIKHFYLTSGIAKPTYDSTISTDFYNKLVGFETVTHIYDLESLRKDRAKFEQFFNYMPFGNCKGCGGHLHIGNQYINNNIEIKHAIQSFFNKNQRLFILLSGRKGDIKALDLNHDIHRTFYNDDAQATIRADGTSTNRYNLINFTEKTIEFRFFNTIKHFETFKRHLILAIAILNEAKAHDYNMTLAGITTEIKRLSKKYKINMLWYLEKIQQYQQLIQ